MAHEQGPLSWANESPYSSAAITPNTPGIVSSEFTASEYFQDCKPSPMKSALEEQVSGNHYKEGGIQPIEFITKNNLSFIIGNVIKYAYRADKKGGADDLFKCIHYLRIELETKYGIKSEVRYDDKE